MMGGFWKRGEAPGGDCRKGQCSALGKHLTSLGTHREPGNTWLLKTERA